MPALRHANGRLLAAVAAAILPLAAEAQVTYDVELKQELNGLPLQVETVPNDGVLVVKVTNNGTAKVRCDVRYDASPQPLGRGYLYVDPGKTEQDAFQARRRWSSVTVAVTCKPKG
jgi:hypothetical protein